MCLDSPDFFVLVFFVCERCIDWSTRVSELVSYPNNNSTLVCTGYRIVPYVSVSRSVCGLGEQVVTCVCVSFFFVLDVLCISSSSRKDCVVYYFFFMLDTCSLLTVCVCACLVQCISLSGINLRVVCTLPLLVYGRKSLCSCMG